MKRYLVFIILYVLLAYRIQGQNSNDILNLLISNKTITQEQADSIRAEAAIKQQETDANRKSFLINAARQIQISGYTQVRSQFLQEKGKPEGIDIRRARLDIKGSITPYWSYRLQTEFAGGPKLIDAYAEFKIRDYLNFTIGQFKIPFSYENLTSSNKLDMIDRAQIVEAMVYRGTDIIGNQNGRDLGLMAGGSFLKKGESFLFDYRLGIFNGSGIKEYLDKDRGKDFAVRLIAHPVKGLDLGISDFYGRDSVNHVYMPRKRLGFEANYEYKRFSTRGEYISGNDGETDRAGYYVQAGYFIIPQKLQLLFRFDQYDKDTNKGSNISTLYVANVNFYFNPLTKLQIGGYLKQEETTQVDNNYLELQFQIGF
jgi:phosphate-selective porin OprO/OprP